ncbi:hypothetical protein BURK2_01633 [Burkholderiales bacterium]|nr:MAG: class IIb bacteriocin, lactobin A/cerein 7B family [Burkholderiales bacterium]CAG0977157.1 hypothetical protein BURK2_01633 [Burkholderiales bacterium]
MQELSSSEVTEVSGGIVPLVAAAYVAGWVTGLVTGVVIAIKVK